MDLWFDGASLGFTQTNLPSVYDLYKWAHSKWQGGRLQGGCKQLDPSYSSKAPSFNLRLMILVKGLPGI